MRGTPVVQDAGAALSGSAATAGTPAGFAILTYLMAMLKFGGAKRDRTADLLNAIQALSQLSYGPT
jgi:hypothetical protein